MADSFFTLKNDSLTQLLNEYGKSSKNKLLEFPPIEIIYKTWSNEGCTSKWSMYSKRGFDL